MSRLLSGAGIVALCGAMLLVPETGQAQKPHGRASQSRSGNNLVGKTRTVGNLKRVTRPAPRPTRSAGKGLWILAGLCMLSVAASLVFRSTKLWGIALLASALAAAAMVLSGRTIWMPGALGLFGTAVAVLVAVRFVLKESIHLNDDSEVMVFMAGLLACAGGAYLVGGGAAEWGRYLLYAVLVGGSLLLFVWRLRRPLPSWAISVGIAHLGMAFVDASMKASPSVRPLLWTGLLMASVGLAGAVSRRNTLTVVVSAQLVVLGAILAAASTRAEILNSQVGWTVAVGLPLVQIGLGLSLAQRLGPDTEPPGDVSPVGNKPATRKREEGHD